MRKIFAAVCFALLLPFMAFANTSQAINLNTASIEELKSLKGIGTVKAQAIVNFRETHGPFKTVDELLEVQGIGIKLIEQNKDALVLE